MDKRTKLIISLIPVAVIICLFFLYPLINTINETQYDFEHHYVGFSKFGEVISSSEFQNAFWYSIKLSIVAVLISVALSVITAMALKDTFIGKKIVLFLYQANISVPHITMAAMVLFLVSQTGLFSSIAYQLGLINNWTDFPLIVEGTSMWGTVISFVLKFTPFIGLSVLSVLMTISNDYENQSLSLGVGRAKTFFHVTLPSLKTAIVSTSLISFAYAIGSYEVPSMLSKNNTLATMAYNYYNDTFNPNSIYYAYTTSLIIAAITITLAVVYIYMIEREDKV